MHSEQKMYNKTHVYKVEMVTFDKKLDFRFSNAFHSIDISKSRENNSFSIHECNRLFPKFRGGGYY